jgi:hypothetical protein
LFGRAWNGFDVSSFFSLAVGLAPRRLGVVVERERERERERGSKEEIAGWLSGKEDCRLERILAHMI